MQTCEYMYVCITRRLLGVYGNGVFLYLHIMVNFVYMWDVYYFDVCGTFLVHFLY